MLFPDDEQILTCEALDVTARALIAVFSEMKPVLPSDAADTPLWSNDRMTPDRQIQLGLAGKCS